MLFIRPHHPMQIPHPVLYDMLKIHFNQNIDSKTLTGFFGQGDLQLP
jgi:hypothetical protein